MLQLFHVSEQPAISRFEPRYPPSSRAGVQKPVVWAVDAEHLCHYLLPRDCPRICASILPGTLPEHRALLSPGSARLVAIESRWFEAAQQQTLYLYHLPTASFRCHDASAGYYISTAAVVPMIREVEIQPLQRLMDAQVELRILHRLQPLQDQVVNSTLAFSCIRMRNALCD